MCKRSKVWRTREEAPALCVFRPWKPLLKPVRMEATTLLVAIFVVTAVSLWWTKRKSRKNDLPGPIGLPIVGYLPFITNKPYVKFQELAKKYGPVYRVTLGSRDIVILCDFKSMKEAFNNDAFGGRPPDLPFDPLEETVRTGAFLGLPWKEQRRFSLHMLRDLGFGKTRMEQHIKDEIEELLQRMESLEGTPTKMSDLMAPSMSNNVASLLFGKRMKFDDPRRKRLDKLISDVGLYAGATAWQGFFPWINAFLKRFKIGNRGKLRSAIEEEREFIAKEMKEHEATLDPNNIRDFLDAYLLEIQKKSDDPNTTFKKEVLQDLALGFFGAGSETVRISVDWLLLFCAASPNVQDKVFNEIENVIGRDRFPTRADSQNMPYTEAVILELGRWKTIVPLNVMHYTLKDTELNGYFIPKHTHVLSVIHAVHHDEQLWGPDVEVFKPERFLGDDGKKIVKPEYFIPFSVGKRSCPGKALAEVEVFLYFTAILQRYKFSLPPGKEADLEGILGIGLQPKRQEVIFQRR